MAFSFDAWWACLFYLGVIPRRMALAIPLVGAAVVAFASARMS